MDFFAIQAAVRRQARWFRWLSVPFLLVSLPVLFLTIVVLLSFVTLSVHTLLDASMDIRLHSRAGGLAPLYPIVALLPGSPLEITEPFQVVWGTIDIIVSLAILGLLLVSLYRARKADTPGVMVGELGALELDGTSGEHDERRLLNIVEEIAVSANVPPTRVYVWEAGPGVNALTLGNGTHATEIYVSSGALALLNREETQALIAHQMSRVMLCARIPVLRCFAALLLLYGTFNLGRWLLRMPRRPRWLKAVRRRDYAWFAYLQWTFYVVYLPFALALWVGGSLQFFVGKLFAASMSRWSIGNADLLALQYTRNSVAIKALLMKVAVHGGGLHRENEENLDLMQSCFAPASHGRWLRTYPSIEARLRAVDPRYRAAELAEFREREASRLKLLELEEAHMEASRLSRLRRRTVLDRTLREVTAQAFSLEADSESLESEDVPSPRGTLVEAVTEGTDETRARLLALLLEESPDLRGAQIDILGERVGERLATMARRCHEREPLSHEQRRQAMRELLPRLDHLPVAQARGLVACIAALQPRGAPVGDFERALAQVALDRLHERIAGVSGR